jgi:O-antigen/teichoic acid export membrane protein
MEKVSLMLLAQSLVKASLSIVLILIGLSVLGGILGHLSGCAVAAILGLTFTFLTQHRKLNKNSDGVRVENPAAAMVKYGFPAYVAALLTTLLTQYQNLTLAHYVSNMEIGNFNASTNFSALINLIAFPITTVLFPAFSTLNPHSDGEALKSMFTLSVKYASLLLVPSSLFVAFLSREFISLTYGESYALAPLYLSFYMGIYLLTGLGSLVLGSLFNGLGETKETLNMTLITALAFIPAAPLAAKMFSVTGLITALIASNLTGVIYGLIQARRKYRLKIDAYSELKIYLSAGIATLTLGIPSIQLPASISICVKGTMYSLTYLTAIALIEAVKKQDTANLSQILNNVKIVNLLAKPILSYEEHLMNLRQRLLK